MLPLNAELKDLIINSIYCKKGNITKDILERAKDLILALMGAGFRVWFQATDGDHGMDRAHRDFCKKFYEQGLDLKKVVKFLMESYEGGFPLIVPVSDGLHFVKTGRTRVVLKGPPLCVNATAPGINGKEIGKILSDDDVAFAKGALSLLDDRLAVEAFRAKTAIAAGEAGNLCATYYLAPYVALMEAIRFEAMTVETRLRFLEIAFTCFRTYLRFFPKHDPKSGNEKIGEARRQGVKRLTLWTRNMCIRGCNLCVAIYWAIQVWLREGMPCPLALARIGTHSIECYFGMIRSLLMGDVREEYFRNAQVKAILVRDYMFDLGMGEVKERFRNEAGCVLPAGSGNARSDGTKRMWGISYPAGQSKQPDYMALLTPEESDDEDDADWIPGNETEVQGEETPVAEEEEELPDDGELSNEGPEEIEINGEEEEEPERTDVVQITRAVFDEALYELSWLPTKFANRNEARVKSLCEAIVKPFVVFRQQSADRHLPDDGYSKTKSPTRNGALASRLIAMSGAKKEKALRDQIASEL
jgi:hypothetical protein